jgi:hypothetical protein
MNQKQIDEFYAFCDGRGIQRPSQRLLINRAWTWILAYRWTNLSINRWMLFGALSEYMTQAEYVQTLRWLWSHSEGDLEPPGVESIFRNHNGHPLTITNFLTPQESQVFNAWPETITIYRGCTDETREGLSWTEHYAVAEALAQMRAPESASGTGLVLTGECSKSNLLCYILNDLREYEALVPYGSVTVTSENTITP